MKNEEKNPSPDVPRKLVKETYVLNDAQLATAMCAGMSTIGMLPYSPQLIHNAQLVPAENGMIVVVTREEAPPRAPREPAGPPDLIRVRALIAEACTRKRDIPTERQMQKWSREQIVQAAEWATVSKVAAEGGAEVPPMPEFMQKKKRNSKPKTLNGSPAKDAPGEAP